MEFYLFFIKTESGPLVSIGANIGAYKFEKNLNKFSVKNQLQKRCQCPFWIDALLADIVHKI